MRAAQACSQATGWYCPRVGGCSYQYSVAPTVNALTVDPRTLQENVLAFTDALHIQLSTDGGNTWVFVPQQPSLLGGGVYSLSAGDDGFLLAGTKAGVYKCTDILPVPGPTPSTVCDTLAKWAPLGLTSNSPAYITGVRRTTPVGATPTYWASTSSGL